MRPTSIPIPDFDAPTRVTRDFNLSLLDHIATILSAAGLLCSVYHQGSDESPNYNVWNATLDGSVSEKHIQDRCYPSISFGRLSTTVSSYVGMRHAGTIYTCHYQRVNTPMANSGPWPRPSRFGSLRPLDAHPGLGKTIYRGFARATLPTLMQQSLSHGMDPYGD